MGTRTSNGDGQALQATPDGGQALRVADAVQQESPASMAEMRRVLTATELRFSAALRQLDRVRRGDEFRKEERALLTEAVAKAQRFAYHDELTGLPNRHLLRDRFAQAAALALRHDQHVGLVFLDLDRFKHVNDTLGRSVGDRLLQQVAARLVACIRASDTACRYGGDEFVVLVPELNGTEGAVIVANNICAHLAAPYLIDGAEITMTASIGIAMHPVDAHGYDELLRLSDAAMFRNKARRPAAPRIGGCSSIVSLLGPGEDGNR